MTTNFRRDFDAKLVAIQQAVDDFPVNLDEYVPGLSRAALKRFFQRFSVLFGRFDKSGARHPPLLAYDDYNVLEYVIDNLDNILDSLREGADAFFGTWMPKLAVIQTQIERALGRQPEDFQELSVSGAEDLRAALQKANDSLEQMREIAEQGQKAAADVISAQAETRRLAAAAAQNFSAMETFKDRLEILASSDGRKKDSFEFLAKAVREKAAGIDRTFQDALSQKDDLESLVDSIKVHEKSVAEAEERIKDIETKASTVLSLSTQAGLASSYLNESKKLQVRVNVFTGILYISAIITLAVAAFYVIPSLESAILRERNPWQAVAISLLRATLLAPLVYVIYFTTRQINGIDTLRMDYAEKAAASLAYSGYRDEMSADQGLLERLKASLLLRFAEHPERLLRKQPSREVIQVEVPGFKASAATSDMTSGGDGDDPSLHRAIS